MRRDVPEPPGGPRDRHLLSGVRPYTAATDPDASGSRAARGASARPAAAGCETSIERARKGMRPEVGARYTDRVRGRALHHLRKHRTVRTVDALLTHCVARGAWRVARVAWAFSAVEALVLTVA